MDNNQEEVGTNNAVVKGKRTKRHRPHSPIPFRVTTAAASPSAVSSESAATAPTTATSSDRRVNTEEEEDMANCLIMLAQGRRFEKFTSRRFLESSPSSGAAVSTAGGGSGYYVYECKTCSKTFPSFQALGGHRASHKKPKNAAAAAAKDEESRTRRSNNIVLSDEDETANTTAVISNNFAAASSLSLQLTNRALYTTAATPATTGQKPRVHECSICGAEFASGQALGGHMRRHRGPAPGGSQTVLTQEMMEEKRSSSASSAVEPTLNNKKPSLDLDLNLPAMPDAEEVNASSTDSKLVFAGKQSAPEAPPAATVQQKQQMVFSPPPALVDCHY